MGALSLLCEGKWLTSLPLDLALEFNLQPLCCCTEVLSVKPTIQNCQFKTWPLTVPCSVLWLWLSPS